MRRLREQGVAIVFVSHFLDQVYEIADRMTILRNGRLVDERMVAETSQLELVRLMIGRELEVLERLDREAHARAAPTTEHPRAQGLGLGRKGSLEATDLTLFEGEVVGIAGLLGSGRTELARLLFGADAADPGHHRGAEHAPAAAQPRATPSTARSLSPARTGRPRASIGDLTVADNMLLALQASRGWLRPIPAATQDAARRASTSRRSTSDRRTRMR